MQVIQLKGKEKRLYQLLGPLVMDPEVIRANNNYPFKTDENFMWFIAIEGKKVIGFIPIEQKNKRGVINNYYIAATDEKRDEILSVLLSIVVDTFVSEGWSLSSVTLIQDRETFEKFEFAPVERKWTRYVQMLR